MVSSILQQKKGPSWPFYKISLFINPAFDFFGAVFSFPFLQHLVVAAFSFNHFAGVWVFVSLQLTRLASAGRLGRRLAARAAMRVQQIDDVFKAEAVFIEQFA